mgnify:CR=1 FL=1
MNQQQIDRLTVGDILHLPETLEALRQVQSEWEQEMALRTLLGEFGEDMFWCLRCHRHHYRSSKVGGKHAATD